MKVCKVENFPEDKIECKCCPDCVDKFGEKKCRIAIFKDGYDLEHSNCPFEGCRPDCPLIPCEGIIQDLKSFESFMDNEYNNYDPFSDDSIKFIKACEEDK